MDYFLIRNLIQNTGKQNLKNFYETSFVEAVGVNVAVVVCVAFYVAFTVKK